MQKTKAAGGALALALTLVAAYEGHSLVAYLDPVGIPTICYGSTAKVRLGQRRTAEECEELLRGELGTALSAVQSAVHVSMPDTRAAALASFTFNVGTGAFNGSTLLRKLNAGDTAGACAELSKWVYAGGKKLRGLERRRAEERELCEIGL